MAHRLEIAPAKDIRDPIGAGICRKAKRYFGFNVTAVRVVHILTIDIDLTPDQREQIRTEIFTNPVTQVSAYDPLEVPFDWIVRVGYRPGVRDNPGSTALEAIGDLLGISFGPGDAVYTSRRYCFTGEDLTKADVETCAVELLANDIIQTHNVYGKADWDPKTGVGIIIPKVALNRTPRVSTIDVTDLETLAQVSRERNLALNPADMPAVRDYFTSDRELAARRSAGLTRPTDVELEYISQARSDHCNHNTFRGKFSYRETGGGREFVVDNLFAECIEAPTLKMAEKKPWVISVLWDNAGVGRLNNRYYYVITGETHNSPSNMEAYGGALTGIVGVYRDPLGTGKGAKLVMGGYGYCVGPLNYDGPLSPRLHPRRLLDGVIEGVKDGGNKSGIPTPFGGVWFHPGYVGKCLVYVTAVGLMPARIRGEPAEQKKPAPGDLIVMCGGRVGKDGIHGVTASSEAFSENTPAGHVQIGDPYTQKKLHDFLLEARDGGMIRFITDNGGGGLSSSVGESARLSGGCNVALDAVPLKYSGLDPWEIWVSESQERMTVAVSKEDLPRFSALSGKHAVESTVIGTYTDTGRIHITFNGETVAYLDVDLVTRGFPQWTFDAEWIPPADRGLFEPVLGPPKDIAGLLKRILARPNIASKEWIARQYDHEVQGTNVVKPLVGAGRDVFSDAAVIRPDLASRSGLAFAQALCPPYGHIDTYAMTACVIDEAYRRVLAVGGMPAEVGGVDNFCWPTIQYHLADNPDGKYKAAQLVRACLALKEICIAYEIPLLSGKDSMYVDGHLPGPFGETHKVSAPPTLQFTAAARVPDVNKCVTMDAKFSGDWVYVLGETRNEAGGSEYYDMLGYVGLNVPRVFPDRFLPMYRALAAAMEDGLTVSVHGVYRGGLGVHLPMVAFGRNLGMRIDLRKIPVSADNPPRRDDLLLFSESAGRFVVTVDPELTDMFEQRISPHPFARVGQMTGENGGFTVTGLSGETLIDRMEVSVKDLKDAWKSTFGDME